MSRTKTAAAVMATVSASTFFAAIWTSGDLAGRLALTGFLSVVMAFIFGMADL